MAAVVSCFGVRPVFAELWLTSVQMITCLAKSSDCTINRVNFAEASVSILVSFILRIANRSHRPNGDYVRL